MSWFGNAKSWSLVPLKEVATLKRGYDLPVDQRNPGNVPIYAANGKNGSHDEVKKKAPSVVTGRSGTIGKVHYVTEDYWPLNTALYVTDFYGNDPKWVYYMLQAFKLERFVEGAGVPTLNRNLVHGELIPLPPLPEQQRIAAILDKADAIRRKRQQAIQLADEFLRSVFLEMFGDPVTNPKGWEVKLCTDICRQITVGLVIKPASYYVDEGIPAIRSLNIGDKGIKRENFVYFSASDNETVLSKSRVYEDDIVIVRSGQPGKAAVIPKELDGINAIDVLIVRPDKEKIEPNFLAFFLNSSAGKSLVMSEERGQVQKHLNVGSLNVAKIPIPPIDRQRQFVKIIKKIRDISEKSKLAECDVMFNALSQRAFAGEL
ncbi:restriction endonuclease subunit S [Thiothrix winogradskyi]|uniref:Restriction endonuclease subunit S n=1 Tax=Thiothrix winogradskyi TaxID=96472 RepID=A0ABY3T3B4_9GAMM|nr:restriction endonuclease subunit S [Thiothrix winogradskyi]UJS25290.1 restriction endonuclease subunit S [Thiothrix winogradskyi]